MSEENLWNDVIKNVEYWCNKKIKYYNDSYVEFQDSTYFNIEKLKKLQEEANLIQTKIDRFILRNNLDKNSIECFEKAINFFPNYKKYFKYKGPEIDILEYVKDNISKHCRLTIESL